jgi:hypothetical protein
MSVRQANSSAATTAAVAATATAAAPSPMVDVGEAANESILAEGNSFNTVAQEKPLKRTVVVSIKSTLNGKCCRILTQHKFLPTRLPTCFNNEFV